MPKIRPTHRRCIFAPLFQSSQFTPSPRTGTLYEQHPIASQPPLLLMTSYDSPTLMLVIMDAGLWTNAKGRRLPTLTASSLWTQGLWAHAKGSFLLSPTCCCEQWHHAGLTPGIHFSRKSTKKTLRSRLFYRSIVCCARLAARNATGMSSNGRTADSGSVNGGSTPSIPAIWPVRLAV